MNNKKQAITKKSSSFVILLHMDDDGNYKMIAFIIYFSLAFLISTKHAKSVKKCTFNFIYFVLNKFCFCFSDRQLGVSIQSGSYIEHPVYLKRAKLQINR